MWSLFYFGILMGFFLALAVPYHKVCVQHNPITKRALRTASYYHFLLQNNIWLSVSFILSCTSWQWCKSPKIQSFFDTGLVLYDHSLVFCGCLFGSHIFYIWHIYINHLKGKGNCAVKIIYMNSSMISSVNIVLQ